MVALIARTGRQNQRYAKGCRLTAGCIPYRFIHQKLEVLVVKAQKSDTVLFPKGGWETDETEEEAALREAMEEAGVEGTLGEKLGIWTFSSKSHKDADHIAYMFPLHVHKLHDSWPEMHRKRIWMQVADARKRVKHQWMTEALDQMTMTMKMELRMIKGYPNHVLPVVDTPGEPESPSKPGLVVMIRPEPHSHDNEGCDLVNRLNPPCNPRLMSLRSGQLARGRGKSLICTSRCMLTHLISLNDYHHSAHPNWASPPTTILDRTCLSN